VAVSWIRLLQIYGKSRKRRGKPPGMLSISFLLFFRFVSTPYPERLWQNNAKLNKVPSRFSPSFGENEEILWEM
jgi:hypothetical protein